MMSLVEEAREAFRPDHVNILFIAEAPPCAKDRFFYFPNVTKGDSLFLHIIREVFPELKHIDTKQIRIMKEELLLRFRNAGYFLEDSSLISIPNESSSSQKLELLRSQQNELISRIEKYKNKSKIILLSAAVYKVNFEFLKNKGYTILNTKAIPFPGSGQQNNFKQAMAEIEF